MTDLNCRKLIAHSFDKLHEQLSVLRSHVEESDDPVARDFLQAMEFGLLSPMRKLRLHMNIPYDWHVQKAAKN